MVTPQSMKMYMCEVCGAEVKHKKPDLCPMCKHKDAEFSEHDMPDPDAEERKSSEKIKEALKSLDEYEAGCPPQELKYAFEE